MTKWKRARVISDVGQPDKFRAGDIVYVCNAGRSYYRVKNPRTGYTTDTDGGWRRSRFKVVKFELDETLGLV